MIIPAKTGDETLFMKALAKFAIVLIAISASAAALGDFSDTFEPLPGSFNPKLTGHADLGPAKLQIPIDFVIVLVDRYAGEATNPKSPFYGHMYSPEEFCRNFGPDPSLVDQIKAYYIGFGMSLTNSSCFLLSFHASVAQINSAFRTEMHNYLFHQPGQNLWQEGLRLASNSTPLMLVTKFQSIIVRVEGLDRVPSQAMQVLNQ